MRYSVVIPSYNEGDELLATVANVFAHSHGAELEVVVVDDHSDDFSGEDVGAAFQLNEYPLTVVRNKERSGVTRSRIIGADVAAGDWLINLDAHSRVTEGWLDDLETAIGMCGNEVLYGPSLGGLGEEIGPDYEWYRGARFGGPDLKVDGYVPRPTSNPYPVMLLPGGCHIINQHYYHEIGGFDGGLLAPWGAEDLELSMRVWMLGGECRLVPSMRVLTLFREIFPYGNILGRRVLCNLLRLAAVYFSPERFAKCIEAAIEDPELGGAVYLLLSSDVMQRRRELEPQFKINSDDLFERFGAYW